MSSGVSEVNNDLNELERNVINDWLDYKERVEEQVPDRDLEEEWLRVYAGRPRITEPFDPLRFNDVSSDKLVSPKPNAVPFSFETQLKHRWVFRMWELYCNSFNITPLFTLDAEAVT
ncbi:hypothetical protein BLNAU_19274 [Blattamonas nauphoetae]|uniref:Uncharacterized protein n=1 Tax=Blattamonas nauphoetae TaxID=2049346 RepID=A0ABQ9X1Y4_9EUKA|nr:hypothetical protein BLNAU_19274 [Blattamonas nauphoetae]